jgi:cysteine-rich repeat protein
MSRGSSLRSSDAVPAGRVFLLAVAAAAALSCGSSDGSSSSAASTVAVCGNGVRESPEECDDGNGNNADGCLTTCQRPVTWVTSDVHVHSTGCSAYATPGELAEKLEAQQIQLGAALVWGEGYRNDSAFFTGRDDPVSTSGFKLHYDMEVSHFPAARTGHLLLLGLDSLQFSSDVFATPQSGVPVVDWARRQPRTIVGMAHGQFWPSDGTFPVPPGGCCVPWEVVVHAARGRLDFLSMERTLDEEPGTWVLWKALQNAGFRVPLTGGSDWSCLADRFHELTPRTDVILDGELTYEKWLQAIKAGRSTAASGIGCRLNLRVEGRRLGDEVQLAAAQEVTATLETAGPATQVQVLVNGATVATAAVAAGVQLAQVRVPITRSSWVSARTPSIVTNPVYVLVGGQPIRASSDDICYLRRSVEHLADLVASDRLRLFESRAEALAAYQEAVTELQRRFTESGGSVCR